MCYRTKLTATISQIEEKFEGKLEPVPDLFVPARELNGFAKPLTPVLCSDASRQLQLAQWGYEVNWQTAPLLNAVFETAKEKASFKGTYHQRCIIVVDGFYEWKWLDAKGKVKEKFLLQQEGGDVFFLAGQYRDVLEPGNSKASREYVIYTLPAEGVMREIHNSKLRMPFAFLKVQDAVAYLKGEMPEAWFEFEAISQAG